MINQSIPIVELSKQEKDKKVFGVISDLELHNNLNYYGGGNFVSFENRIDGDTDTIINKKVKSSLKNNIKIILCIGETNKQKINKQTNRILKKQIVLSLKGIRSIKNIIFAYEPVWAIGTGKVPKKYELSKNILYIKSQIQNKFKKTQNINILYGGSVNPRNIAELNSIDHLNGYLIGGASKSSKKFIDIMNKTYK